MSDNNLSIRIHEYSEYADTLSLTVTDEGIIMTFLSDGEEVISVARTYDEWIEHELDRLEMLRQSMASHPVNGVRLTVLDGGLSE